jgi:hypothetical protein
VIYRLEQQLVERASHAQVMQISTPGKSPAHKLVIDMSEIEFNMRITIAEETQATSVSLSFSTKLNSYFTRL